MRRLVCLLVFIAVISPPSIDWSRVTVGVVAQDSAAVEQPAVLAPSETPAPDADPVDQLERQLERELGGEFGAGEVATSTAIVQSLGVADWLGPLAPVALSPFFGVTCMSGLSIWGPDWVADAPMLQRSGPLKNRALFCLFLVLTVLTSVPRLTKVSKPFAQSVDRLEAYSVIVILLAIKLAESTGSSAPPVAMLQLGFLSFTFDALLAIAMVVNILVINSVKFFFEFMVWLTPVPFLDAVFEICNKTLCAVLIAIYAFSPTLALMINLVMFLVAAIVLHWIYRRVRFYRAMILDPVLARVWSRYGQPNRPELIAFAKAPFGPFAAKSRIRLRRATEGGGWLLQEANWLMPEKKQNLPEEAKLTVRRGWVMHSIEISSNDSTMILSFSRRYDEQAIRQLAEQLGIAMSDASFEENQDELAYEFS